MEISIFDVLGPIMIGPSSSHTAGAARLARVAAALCQKPFEKVQFGLSGSFAKTGWGHGTQKALVAGVLGFAQDDERIPNAEAIAKNQGLVYEFYTEDLDWIHENAVHISFCHPGGAKTEIWGCSIGGGRININRIGDFETKLTAEKPTLLVQHLDRPGVVSEITAVLAKEGINIALFRLARRAKGDVASASIILDSAVPEGAVESLRKITHVQEVIYIDIP